MADIPAILIPVLELLPQPALLCRDGLVQYANGAAVQLGLTKNSDAPEIPKNAQSTLKILGQLWSATCRPMEDYLLMLFSRGATEESAQLYGAVCRSLSPALTTVFTEASRLFPRLEEMEDESLQRHTAALSKAYFELLRTKNAMELYSFLHSDPGNAFKKPDDLADVFRTTAQRAEPYLAQCGQTLEYEGPQGSIWSLCDRNQLQQAMLQLLTNAAGACKKGDTIRVELSRKNTSVFLTVRDPGRGMPPEVFASAFSRYQYALEPGETEQSAGLGLSIVRAIADRHGGSVALQSKPGEGTCVTMMLRITEPDTCDLASPIFTIMESYDPVMTEFAPLLPADAFDTRNIDL